MSLFPSVFHILALILAAASVCISKGVAYPLCSRPDARMLRAFYKSAHIPNQLWANRSDCCAWHGILCNSYGHVVSVHLSSFNLSGPIPAELFGLVALESLNLSANFFSGHIPAGITNLPSLAMLDLSYNKIGGSIPLQIGGLASLETLRLQGNQLTGTIPDEIGNCSQLRQLWLDDNALQGLIPETVGNLRMLTVFSLANNRFEGPFPLAITKCALLSYLSLSGNMLSGDIPASLGSLLHLKILLLRDNQFSGVLPLDRKFLEQLRLFDTPSDQMETWHKQRLSQLFGDAHAVSQKGDLACASITLREQGFPCSFLKTVSKHLLCSHVIACDALTDILEDPLYRHSRHLLQNDDGSGNDSNPVSAVTIGILVGVSVFCMVLLVVGMIVICRMKVRPWSRSRPARPPIKLASIRKFRRESSRVFDPTLASISMRDLVKATDGFDFSRVVGDGGFGLVYCATLQDGRTVAVKKLTENGMQGKREFEAEMETLGNIKHRNLVELLAYCKVGDERVLVYEFVENGSLDAWLHEREDGPVLLNWATRVKIACGAARGLAYLHYDCNPCVLHRDVKSSNILLDKDFEPKIADFGLARRMSPLVSHVSTDAAGTLGYMAPEYTLTLNATKQADVYSFGMLMLELASGRRPNLLLQEKGYKKLSRWASHMLQIGREMDVLDPAFTSIPPPSDQVRAYFAVACDCVTEQPGNRPTMTEVHERLSLIGAD